MNSLISVTFKARDIKLGIRIFINLTQLEFITNYWSDYKGRSLARNPKRISLSHPFHCSLLNTWTSLPLSLLHFMFIQMFNCFSCKALYYPTVLETCRFQNTIIKFVLVRTFNKHVSVVAFAISNVIQYILIICLSRLTYIHRCSRTWPICWVYFWTSLNDKHEH